MPTYRFPRSYMHCREQYFPSPLLGLFDFTMAALTWFFLFAYLYAMGGRVHQEV